ncbi:NEURL1 [Branchiostoma lanceolatum]|uniref:NEURL1 protein n=1 Tax=Branchiostoma lanceolatum TaxID=7740 RepID=A0A8K0EGF6_BRALA|nr:NEURL1 [Branchiostoma lanceolatum]
MATPTWDMPADTKAQPMSGKTGATVNNADVKGDGNVVLQTGNDCTINLKIEYNTDPHPWGINYRTVGDNQATEQEKHGMKETQVGNLTASDETWEEKARKAVEILMGPKHSGGQEGMRRFHPTAHGTQVRIENNGTVARSEDSFNNSLCFSEMPIKVGEKVHLKVIDSRIFDEPLRFGFTNEDPKSLAVEGLQQISYPTLAQQPGFWVKPLPASQAHQGCVVTFTLAESGDVTFAVDGEDKGLFFNGVDTTKPLWAVLDVHGSTVAVQFVGEQAASEAFDKQIHEGDQVQVLVNDTETFRDMQSSHGGFASDMSKVKGEVGIALRIEKADVHVFFPSINKRWCITPAALGKVKMPDIRSTAIIGGDLVKIAVGRKKLKSIQKKHHLWKNDMEKIRLDEIGLVKGVLRDGEVAVRMAGKFSNTWIFHPKVLQKTGKQGVIMCDKGLHHWKRGVSKVCVKCGECTAEGDECSMKGKPLRSPGSCCGCKSQVAGCADCGVCRSCAGQGHDDIEMLDLFGSFFMQDLSKCLADEGPNEYGLKRGDVVKVSVDKDIFKRQQEENGLPWAKAMVKLIGVPGIIVAKLPRNDVVVYFQNEAISAYIFSGCLTKTSNEMVDEKGLYKKGDLVRVIKDEEQLKKLQDVTHGGYNDEMKKCLGKTGCVIKIEGRTVQVGFLFTRPWVFNPEAITEVSADELQKPIHQLQTGDCVKVAVSGKRFNVNQVGHGGPVDKVRQVMEKPGIVLYVDRDGDAFVLFQNGFSNVINPASLEKVNPDTCNYKDEDSSELKEGEWVKVDADKARIKKVQTETVPWDDGFYAAAGKVGCVENIDPSRKIVRVSINTGVFPMTCALVKRASLDDMQGHFTQSMIDSDFARGDLVKVNVTPEELKVLQVGHGGYIATFENLGDLVQGKPGSVCFIDCEGDVYVRFNTERMCLNPKVLSKVTTEEDTVRFNVGDLVHIESDLDKFKSLQTPGEHGGYQEEMAELCGKTGRLLRIVNDKKVVVKVQGRPWAFNPDLLRRLGGARADTSVWKSATICAPGKHDWSAGRCLVCVVCGECTHHGKLCPARRGPCSTPGSVVGCGNGNAGCDDCGACMSCAGDKEDGLDKVIKETIENTVRQEVFKRLQSPVDDTKTAVMKHRRGGYGEGDMEIVKMLVLLLNMSRTVDMMRKSKHSDSVAELLYVAVNAYTKASLEFGHAVGRSGLLLMTVQELARRQEMEVSDRNQGLIGILVGILSHCARVPENMDYFRDIRAADLLKKHLKEEDMPLRVMTICCLARIVDAEDPDVAQLQADDMDFFMNIFSACVSDVKHETFLEKVTWVAVDLVRDLLALARNDGIKHAFVRKGVMEPLIHLVEGGDDMEKEYAMLCVQSFAMVDSIRETILSETRVEEVLRALLTQQDQIYAVLATARKTLKCLGK